jgi:EAL domain-containing protein (putative c-di-GMP-specific phosphodiesterase class I)
MAPFIPLGVANVLPFLEHFPEPGGPAHRTPLSPLPFRIGRSSETNLVVYSRQVSLEHAEISEKDGRFSIRDLQSTNGTFVNGQNILEALLHPGDIVHIAHVEFRFGYESIETVREIDNPMTEFVRTPLPPSLIRGSQLLQEMLQKGQLRILFQPIVDLANHKIMGYEALGRGNLIGLSPYPHDLFQLAHQCKMAAELSRTFRLIAVKESCKLPGKKKLFLNLHPEEIRDAKLLESLHELKEALPEKQAIVLEVHEDAVADLATLKKLREQLDFLGIELVYDDFGAGQARFMELLEVTPHFIKLDMRLIRGIHLDSSRKELIRGLVQVAEGLQIQVIAEGIESREEESCCLDLGCHFGQGFYFQRPQSAESMTTPTKNTQ